MMVLKRKVSVAGFAGSALATFAAVLALAATPALAQEHGRERGGRGGDGHRGSGQWGNNGGGQSSESARGSRSGGGDIGVWRQGESRPYRPQVERVRPAPSTSESNPDWNNRAARSQGGSAQQTPGSNGQRWNGYTQRSQRWNGEAQPERRWNGQPEAGQRWNGQPRADTPPAAPSTSGQDRRQNRGWSQRNGTYSDGGRNRTYSRDGRDGNWRDRDNNNNWRSRDGNWRDNDSWRDNSNANRWRGDGRRVDRDHRRWDRDWRRDNRYNWSTHRRHNRDVYRLGRYYAPYDNYSYRRLSIGFYLDNLFFSSRYLIDDPWMYRLPQAYGPYRWVRYYDDALLVNIYDGEVVDVIHDFFW